MTYRVSIAFAVVVFCQSLVPAVAQHGGSGGHGGGFSGHMGGHVFGHSSNSHSTGSHHRSGSGSEKASRNAGETPPLAGAAFIHGRVVQLPGPGRPGLGVPRPNQFPRLITEFGFSRGSFFALAFESGFGFCSPLGGFPRSAFFGTAFGCFDAGFGLEPFFSRGFGGDDSNDQGSNQDDASAPSPFADEGAWQTVLPPDEPHPPVDNVVHHRRSPLEPDTLLQLRDGSMYGLRDYWVENGRFVYLTNYGGQNSIPLSRIDYEKTVALNAERGERFTFRPSNPD